jgi:hypothetical protein
MAPCHACLCKDTSSAERLRAETGNLTAQVRELRSAADSRSAEYAATQQSAAAMGSDVQ